MQRDDSLLLDMLQAARQIREYTSGLQETDFLNSRELINILSCSSRPLHIVAPNTFFSFLSPAEPRQIPRPS